MRDGWQQLSLHEAAEVTIGRQRSPKNATGPSMVPYLRAANIKDGHLALDDVLEMNFSETEQATYELRHGDVLVTEGCGSIRELGASAGWDASMEGTVCFQNTLLRLRAVAGMTLPAFLEQWARWAHRSGVWASTASGTNIFHIGVQRAREVPILVPPLAIQRRICDLIGVIEDTMAATEQLEERARVVHRSLGQELIESKGWPRARLADLLETIDGGRSPVTEGRRPVGAERGVLKLSAVKPGRFQLLETKAIGADVAMPPSAQVSVGDVLITRSNTPETVGAVCHVERVLPLTFLSDLTLRLVPGPLVSPRYLSEALNTGPARRQIIGSASGTSGSMRKISRRTIREIVIPVPPAEEQARIDEILDGASTAVDAARSQLSALGELRSAMVAGLLTGDIELADSYDELLERAS